MSIRIFFHGFLVVVSLGLSSAATAKLPKVSLKTLYEKSDVVASGRIVKKSDDWILIAGEIYKGEQGVEIIYICPTDGNSDDAGYVDGLRVFVFLHQNGSCFETIFGYKGLIRLENDGLLTIAIDGEPPYQSEQQLLDSLSQLSK